jgi:hypothetical protein
MDNRKTLLIQLMTGLEEIIELKKTYNVMKGLTYDLFYKTKDRHQVAHEVSTKVDMHYILDLEDTDLNYFIFNVYFALYELVDENGVETTDEEIGHLIDCFEGKEKCGLNEKLEAEKRWEEIKKKNWYFHKRSL